MDIVLTLRCDRTVDSLNIYIGALEVFSRNALYKFTFYITLVLRMRACMLTGYYKERCSSFRSLFLVAVCSVMFTLYHCCLIIRRHGRHTTRTRQGEQHTDTGRCPGHRTPHALVAYSGTDEESTGADRRHPPA